MLVLGFMISSCAKTNNQKEKQLPDSEITTSRKVKLLSFGAGFCIECKKMKDVIDKLNEKNIENLTIECYNVMDEQGKILADIYNIKMIPAQIFLNDNNNEFFRHFGFLSMDETLNILKQRLSGI